MERYVNCGVCVDNDVARLSDEPKKQSVESRANADPSQCWPEERRERQAVEAHLSFATKEEGRFTRENTILM